MQLYCPGCGKAFSVGTTSGPKTKITCDKCGNDNIISKPTRRKTVIEIYTADRCRSDSKTEFTLPND